MKILSADQKHIRQAQALVNRIFKWQSPLERLSFIVIRNPRSLVSRFLRFISAIDDTVDFYVALDDSENVIGTSGLYTCKHDSHEAAWLSWFCVAPEARGKGLGKILLNYTISHAMKRGYSYLRLYTSTDPNEAAAQILYEKYGFRVVRRKKVFHVTKLFREKKLI